MSVLPETLAASVIEDGSAEPLSQQFKTNFKEISRQSAIFLVGTLFTLAAGYFVKIYVARVLGAQPLGIYALGMTIVSFVQLWGALGLPAAAARYVAAYNRPAQADSLRAFLTRTTVVILVLNLSLGIGMAFAGRAAARFYHAPQLAPMLPLFAALMFLGAITNFFSQVAAGFKDVARRTMFTNFVATPLGLVLTVILLQLGTGLWGYVVAQVISTSILTVLLVRLAWKLTPVPARFSSQPLPPLEREVVSFAGASLGMNVVDFLSSQADKILLGLFLSPKLLGIYVLASTLVAFVPILLQSVNQIFAPVIADLYARGESVILGKLYRTLTRWILAATLPAALLLIVFAPQWMRIFGSDFEPGWPILAIGTVGQVVNCAVGSVGFLLLMSGNQKRLLKVQVASALVSVAANLLLIPVWGIVGAAVAAALINVVSNIWNLVEVRRSLQFSPFTRSYFSLLLPTAVLVACLLLVRHFAGHLTYNWRLLLPASFLSYALFAGACLPLLCEDDRLIAAGAWRQCQGNLRKMSMRAS